jgi:hypothetical protein
MKTIIEALEFIESQIKYVRPAHIAHTIEQAAHKALAQAREMQETCSHYEGYLIYTQCENGYEVLNKSWIYCPWCGRKVKYE